MHQGCPDMRLSSLYWIKQDNHMTAQTPRNPLFATSSSKPKRKRGSYDRVVERDGRSLRYSGIGRAGAWYSALLISPSYELARQCRAGVLPERAKLPADFDAVLSVYDDLGDVRREIDEWLNDRAFRAFGYGGEKPSVTGLGVVRYDGELGQFDAVRDNLYGFERVTWVEQGERTSLIAVIPNGLSKAQIVKQIMAMLDDIPATERDLSPAAPKYEVLAKGKAMSSVRKYLRCVEHRARKPSMTLWQIGAAVKLSTMYNGRLDPKAKPAGDVDVKDRTALKILTSRAIQRGHMIAENAARGTFPSYAKCSDAMAIDWIALAERLK